MWSTKRKDKAVLRSMVNKDAQTYATRRLVLDLKEIETNDIPTVGVTARPLESSLFTWHGNIRGPEGTPYEGGVFHVELDFPATYPNKPPTIRLFTGLPHPCVSDRNIQLDMLCTKKQGIYQGWTSAYSVMSILLQLQAFLFEEPDNPEEVKTDIKKAVKRANEFQCNDCGHRGPLAPSPPFSLKENDSSAFLMLKSEEERLKEELVCFHTRLSHKDTPLGIGVSIARIPRTGEIRSVFPAMDLLSLKAFIKQGVRLSADNTKFTHWLPLYFGDHRERTLHLARRALSVMVTGSTRKFQPSMVLAVLPQLMLTLNRLIMDEQRPSSLKAFQMFYYFHRLFMLLIEEYPELRGQIDETIANFIADEKYRHKDYVNSLGSLMALLSVSEKFGWRDLAGPYLQESYDRSVFWTLKDLPELDLDGPHAKKDSIITDEMAQVCFKSQLVGKHIIMLWHDLINLLLKPVGSNLSKVTSAFDSRFGKLTPQQEVLLQKRCNEIKTVTDWDDFYRGLGMPVVSKDQLTEILNQAQRNSKRRLYHGSQDDICAVPSPSLSLTELRGTFKPIEEFIVSSQESEVDGQKVTQYVLREEEDLWIAACGDRWPVIKDLLNRGLLSDKITPYAALVYSRLADNKAHVKDFFARLTHFDTRVPSVLHSFSVNSSFASGSASFSPLPVGGGSPSPAGAFVSSMESKSDSFVYSPAPTPGLMALTWRGLYLKLELEEFLLRFNVNPDFVRLYKLLDICSPYVTCLELPIVSISGIKSGFHYVTAVLSRLQKLQELSFQHPVAQSNFGNHKLVKALFKGLNNAATFNVLESIDLSCLRGAGSLSAVFDALMPYTHLTRVVARGVDGLPFKKIGLFVINSKSLRELDLSGASVGDNSAKELADAFMRAKNLERVNLSHSGMGNTGCIAVLYSLSFSPSVTHVIMEGLSLSNSLELRQALTKLLRISSSIKHLSFAKCPSFCANALDEEFFKALGQQYTLEVLDFSGPGGLTGSLCDQPLMLGRAIAFNARFQNKLQFVNLSDKDFPCEHLQNLVQGMHISEADYQTWYGDKNNLAKLTSADFEKKFFCNLTRLSFSTASLNLPMQKDNKTKDPKKLVWQNLLCHARGIEVLHLDNCRITKTGLEHIALALDPSLTRATQETVPSSAASVVSSNGLAAAPIKVLTLSRNTLNKDALKLLATSMSTHTKLQVLDLSGTHLGVAGAQSLAGMLKVNRSIKSLYLYSNLIDVDGARAFGAALAVNDSLQVLDLGLNRIRNEGLKAIAQGIVANPRSCLQILGLRLNFLTDDGILDFVRAIAASSVASVLTEILIKGNRITDPGLTALETLITSNHLPMQFDLKYKLRQLDALSRTIWISPFQGVEGNVHDFVEKHEVGTVLSTRIRSIKDRRGGDRLNFAFVEFAHENSVTRALHLASEGKAVVGGRRVRIFRAGSSTKAINETTGSNKTQNRDKPAVVRAPKASRGGRGGSRGGRGGRR